MKTLLPAAVVLALVVSGCGSDPQRATRPALYAPIAKVALRCAPDNAGLTLPAEFCATVFADNLGQARHMVVARDGMVYVNTWRSPYKKDAKLPAGGYIVRLMDRDGDGVADWSERFGEDSAGATHVGGTGIDLHGEYLYAEQSGKIVRWHLDPQRVLKDVRPDDVVVWDLPLTGGHTMHPFVITPRGVVYVNSGSATNACQVKDRELHSPGIDPCEELALRAGIWKFLADRTDQQFLPRDRYVGGLRNTVAITLHPSGALYAVPHGRDQLHENWPERFTPQQGSELPAEAIYRVDPLADYGWPYCYYDPFQRRYFLAPEYGGDGKKTERCEKVPQPDTAFPAHWAPNGALFYTGSSFPDRYRNGAFIAFHGSWNRSPEQQGYNVVFQPMDRAGRALAPFEVFADGFAGAKKDPAAAEHRPTGIAMGPDGALYVSDDQGGRVYRIVRRSS
jgi:glucose/arabinose dehydrogenase